MALITELVESPYLMQGVLVAIVLLFLSGFSRDLAHGLPYKNIPIVGRSRWELSNKKAKNHFMTSARELIAQGFEQVRAMAWGNHPRTDTCCREGPCSRLCSHSPR